MKSQGTYCGHRQHLEHVRKVGLEPKFILDVGANRGDWTRMALAVFPTAKYLLIEPQEEMRSSLDALSRKCANVQFKQCAAGAAKGDMLLTIWNDLAGSSLLLTAPVAKAWGLDQRSVPVERIDVLVDGLVPDIVKLDIQGFELQALQGATGILGRTELFILEASLFEFIPGMPTLRAVIDFMGDRDYEPYDILEPLRRPLDGAVGQVDVAFARRQGLLRRSNAWE